MEFRLRHTSIRNYNAHTDTLTTTRAVFVTLNTHTLNDTHTSTHNNTQL